MILILPPPIGYVHLYQAVEKVGRAACGARWVSVHCQDELKGAMMAPSAALQDVIMSIAEACEAGKLAAAYPNALGSVDSKDSLLGANQIQGFFLGGGLGCDGSFGVERRGLGANGAADHRPA